MSSTLISRFCLITAVVAAAVMMMGCPPYTPEPTATVTVPDVVGLTESAARDALSDADLYVGLLTEQSSATIPWRTVISQDPAAGESVAELSSVALVVSKGPEPVTAPDGAQTETFLLPGDVPLDMTWIPGGTFMMGAYPGEQDEGAYERPQHSVTLPGFWMGIYEMTQAQWKAIMGEAIPGSPERPPNHAIDDASRGQAKAFVQALNNHTGKAFALPSEAQWEYACRAGATTRFYWGDDPDYTQIGNYAWYGHAGNSGNETHAVGQKLPNAFGLYDMSGNVREWCEDAFYFGYEGAPTDGSPWANDGNSYWGVLRGGNYLGCHSDPVKSWAECRSAARLGAATDCGEGFRVVLPAAK